MKILALDPSIAETGVAVLSEEESASGGVLHTESIKTGTRATEKERLCRLFYQIGYLVHRFMPEEIAIEIPFVGNNPKTAIKLGGVRGLILVIGGRRNLPIFEYTTFEIKRSVTGNPSADKEQVRRMVKRITGLDSANDNISDAVAVGLCHLQKRRFEKLVEG